MMHVCLMGTRLLAMQRVNAEQELLQTAFMRARTCVTAGLHIFCTSSYMQKMTAKN